MELRESSRTVQTSPGEAGVGAEPTADATLPTNDVELAGALAGGPGTVHRVGKWRRIYDRPRPEPAGALEWHLSARIRPSKTWQAKARQSQAFVRVPAVILIFLAVTTAVLIVRTIATH